MAINFFDRTFDVVAKDLEGLSRRFESISGNLSNQNTPGYARREVHFEEQLREIVDGPVRLPLKVSDPEHISRYPRSVDLITPRETRVDGESQRLDGNSVDPEIEMAKLAETRMGYGAMNRLLGKKGSMYKLVIGGR